MCSLIVESTLIEILPFYAIYTTILSSCIKKTKGPEVEANINSSTDVCLEAICWVQCDLFPNKPKVEILHMLLPRNLLLRCAAHL